MSAASATSTRNLPRRSHTPSEPLGLRLLLAACLVPLVAYLVWRGMTDWKSFVRPEAVLWIAVVAAADARPLPLWGSLQVAMSFPVLLAGALVFSPPLAALMGLLGPVDMREFRREVSFTRAALNRSIIGLSVLGASSAYHALDGDVHIWPEVVTPSLVALLVDMAINGALVLLGTHLLTSLPPREILWHMTGGEDRAVFLTSYMAFGLLALLLATVHTQAGIWSPIAFCIPLFLAQRMFSHWKHATDASAELLAKQRALAAAVERIADERREERLAIAAHIHDEVLQPLYQVHLLGQVIRQDLATGRLLELEEDVPSLIRATNAANTAIREILRDARSSPLGSRGLVRTLALLADDLRRTTDANIALTVEDVGGSALTQLLLYQIAREALVNAARHAHAENIQVTLTAADGCARLIVVDDGVGFQPDSIKPGHFGLQLMRERAEIAGGSLVIESSARGVMVVAAIPLGRDL